MAGLGSHVEAVEPCPEGNEDPPKGFQIRDGHGQLIISKGSLWLRIWMRLKGERAEAGSPGGG